MSLNKADALKALKLIRMPAPKARAVLDKVAPKKVGSAAKGAKFVGTNVHEKFNKVASKSVGAGAVGRSLIARAGNQSVSKPLSKAQAIVRVYDAADPKDKTEILAAALRAGLSKAVLDGFSKSGNGDKVNS